MQNKWRRLLVFWKAVSKHRRGFCLPVNQSLPYPPWLASWQPSLCVAPDCAANLVSPLTYEASATTVQVILRNSRRKRLTILIIKCFNKTSCNFLCRLNLFNTRYLNTITIHKFFRTKSPKLNRKGFSKSNFHTTFL